MSLVVVTAWLALLLLAGQGLLTLAGPTGAKGHTAGAPVAAWAPDPLFALLAGLVVLHLLLTVLDLLALRWSLLTVALPLLPLAVVAAHHLRRQRGPRLRPPRLDWGLLVAAGCLLAIASLSQLEWLANPDFIYHWGIKAKKFTLAGGIDYAFLRQPWNVYLHPDYPNLVPELFTVTALLEGRFRDASALLWSVVANLFLFLATARLLDRAVASLVVRQATLATVALAVTSLTVSWRLAGNADAWMSLAVLAGALCLLGAGDPHPAAAELEVGFAAAFAAAVKIEGLPFGAFLLLFFLVSRARLGQLSWRSCLRATLPFLLVVSTWLWSTRHHGLAQGYYTGTFASERLTVVPRAMLDISLNDGWHGISLVCLILLPLLLLFRPARLLAGLLLLQLGFYLYAYLTGAVDTEMLVRTSFPRLMLHLVPVILVLGAQCLERWTQAPLTPRDSS